MATRRDVMTAVAAVGIAGSTHAGGAAAQSPEVISAQALQSLANDVDQLRQQFQQAFIGPSLSQGLVVEVRRQFGIFLKANQKYPDFCEIGPNVFTDLYDWHVRYQQPIEVTRVDNRTAIRFMFTFMILRPEQTDNFVGIPFDRG
jgi:hypothetical protein